MLNGAKKCSRNSTDVSQIWSTTSLLETKYGSIRELESKQQSTVWIFQNEPKPTKVVYSRSAAKQMIACFFGYTGHVTTVALEDRRTVNTDWYTTICLPEVINELRKTNRNRRIILHHDNASTSNR